MRVLTRALQTRWMIIATLVLLVTVVVLIAFSTLREDPMSPRQARDHVASIVDGTLARIVPGLTPVPGNADGTRGVCFNRFGGTSDAKDLMYDREITDADFDPALGGEIVERAERYWREQGLDIHRDDKTPGVTIISSGADGFSYMLIVNRNEPLIAVSGQTPCFPASELEEAGLA